MPPKQGSDRTGVYTTPDPFIAAVKRLLGIERFAVDLAADATNAKAPRYFDEAADSLQQDWGVFVGWAWLNPPFFDIAPWAGKADREGNRIAMLVPASVGANWFRDNVHGKALVIFLSGRLRFLESRPEWTYPKDCMLILFGAAPGYCLWEWENAAKLPTPWPPFSLPAGI